MTRASGKNRTNPANPSTDPVDVLLLGTHGQCNIGDELLLETFLGELGVRHRYRINSYDPAATQKRLEDRYDVEAFDTGRDRLGLIRHLRECDVVLFGGGSIVKELGPTTGRPRHATLLMLLVLVTVARLVARRPVLMSNIGVGPIHTRLGRLLARLVLRQVSLVSVRDAGSYALCRRLGYDPDRLRLVPDAVWARDPRAFGGSLCGEARSTGRLRIGLNLNRDIVNAARWDDVLDELRDALRMVGLVQPIELVGLPMQTGFKEHDDLEMLQGFLASVPEIPSAVYAAHDHREIAARAATCDVVVAERLHALVIAAILGRPIVALSYDPKVDELVSQLDLSDRAVDVNRPFDPIRLAAMICTAAIDDAESGRLRAAATKRRRTLAPYFDDVGEWLARRGVASSWADLSD